MPKRGSKRSPNILITGTPGVGKSTLAAEVAKRTGMEWINISELAKDKDCIEEFDDVYQCPVLNEDKVVQVLEEEMKKGGKIIDYHGCEFFPDDWFDIVFVLRTDNTVLYDRLQARGYSGKKLSDNIECEIFQILLEEAKESFGEVHELKSNNPEDITENAESIVRWIRMANAK